MELKAVATAHFFAPTPIAFTRVSEYLSPFRSATISVVLQKGGYCKKEPVAKLRASYDTKPPPRGDNIRPMIHASYDISRNTGFPNKYLHCRENQLTACISVSGVLVPPDLRYPVSELAWITARVYHRTNIITLRRRFRIVARVYHSSRSS